MEPDESKHDRHGPVGGGGESGDSAPIHTKRRLEEEEGKGGLKSEEAMVNGGEGSRAGYDTVAPADHFAQVTEGEALTKNLAMRKRAASLLHQLLLTVRMGCIRWLVLLPQHRG